jgi:hypothetical protein
MDIENRLKEIKKIKRKKEIGSSPKKKLKGSLYRSNKKEAINR